eukprot:GGOE01044566.1.p1 GENE.GGOE01044566.1~~GGOE01044566.1.p1  ORF type:complete len:101 (+),score=1.92 GGOE01044566.1:26-328(+)
MGSTQSIPADIAACEPLQLSDSLHTTSSSVNDGHWLRSKSWWPGSWCYEGTVCSADRIRSLDGWALRYGGPGSCSQNGYSHVTNAVSLGAESGQWSDGHD